MHEAKPVFEMAPAHFLQLPVCQLLQFFIVCILRNIGHEVMISHTRKKLDTHGQLLYRLLDASYASSLALTRDGNGKHPFCRSLFIFICHAYIPPARCRNAFVHFVQKGLDCLPPSLGAVLLFSRAGWD
jgi:hypothetical protein